MSDFLTILVKIIFSLVGAAAVFGISYGFTYLKKKNPQGFAEMIAAANTVVNILKNYFLTNPDVAKEAQIIYDLFVSEIIKLIPYATDAEVESLFKSIIGVLASALGIEVTVFAAVKVNTKTGTRKLYE